MQVKFPMNVGQKYYDIHYKYLLNIFKYLKYDITMVDRGQAFIVTLNNKDFLIDYADTSEQVNDLSPNKDSLPTFKFHCNVAGNNVYPFPPVSFYDWDAMYRLQSTIKYNPASTLYSYRTRAYGNAIKRRTEVKQILERAFHPNHLLTSIVSQEQFFNEFGQIKCYIHSDGNHLGMIDRSVSQAFALGCPVITSYKPDLLPFGATWDKCYIKCSDDYSDLITKIGLTADSIFIEVAQRAKEQFNKYCTPEAIGKYLEEIVSYV